jgi:hypothetical protein
MSTEMVGSMTEYVWDTHIDLVREFAPDGLKEFGVIWLNPINVGDRVDILEELNAYFLCIVDNLDKVLQNDNDDDHNAFAIFLDETITDCITKWLKGREQYRIYPTINDSSDTFPNGGIFTIMQLILETHVKPNIPQQPAQEQEQEQEHVQEQEQVQEHQEQQQEQVQEHQEQQQEQVQEQQQEQPLPKQAPVTTIASALRRRRTMRAQGRRIHSVKGTRKHKM